MLTGLGPTTAQERMCRMPKNQALLQRSSGNHHTAKKTTAISLPFFDDFTGYSPYPDSSKWVDDEAYVNNTFAVGQPDRGVATLDNLNSMGLPYDTLSNTSFGYADSLTSQPINIDLSVTTPADSLYLSFMFQAQGTGYYPMPQDSLMLFFKNIYGNYVKVWSFSDTNAAYVPFQMVMIPITDSQFFGGAFQFRFVNVSAAYWSGSDWNLDYVRLDKNRWDGDTAIADVGYTSNPTFLLNDYTSMPYYQFLANTAGEIAVTISDSVRNDTSFGQGVVCYSKVSDAASGATLYSSPANLVALGPYATAAVTDSLSITSYPSYPYGTAVHFLTSRYFVGTPSTGITVNDTIVGQQVFDNYLAYYDGSAERAYYLNMVPDESEPAEIQIEYHLNRPDTLRGLAIYFAGQVPLADKKEFFINVYTQLAGVNGYYFDNMVKQVQNLYPGYVDTVNHFWIYPLDTPLVLPAGTFYAGIEQPAYSGSDSLYIGLDVNRVGANHTYYRVTGSATAWNPSLFNGAVMMRPLLGREITSSKVAMPRAGTVHFAISPNPAKEELEFVFDGDYSIHYTIYSVSGIGVMHGALISGQSADIAQLAPGTYIAEIQRNDGTKQTSKFIKL